MSWLHAVVDVPEAVLAQQARFWGQVTGWPLGDAWPRHRELRSFEPRVGAPYLHLQHIDGPPRVHIDLESPVVASTVARAGELGARVVGQVERWVTLQSPGGLPFCVLRATRHDAPAAHRHRAGHRSRPVQVCIDSPEPAHASEVEFWRSLLRARWVDSVADEFAGKWHDDDGSPLQLLFQRLDEPAGPVRAHLDLGTDDVSAEVARLVALGASDISDRRTDRGWHVLQDPAGLEFCVTDNAPAQTRHRDLG